MIRYYLRVTGRVQGVGFRWFARHAAGLHSLTGWVRNLDDGSVDMEVQGRRLEADAFVRMIREGNRFSQVDTLEQLDLDVVEEREFRVLDS